MERIENPIPKNIQNLESVSKSETEKAVANALSQIDDKELRDIFLETLLPAGQTGAWQGFLPRDSISVIYDESIKARGRFKSKSDSIEDAHIILNAAGFTKLKPEDVPLATLYTYVHEQVHAMSTDYSLHKGYDDDLDSRFVGFKKVEVDYKTKEENVSYTELNEGMTEIIAEEVANEYLRRRGELSGSHRALHHAENSLNVYMEYKVMVEGMFNMLSDRLGQPAEVIKKAVIRDFFQKKNPYQNFTNWLESNFPDIAEKVKNPENPRISF